MDATKTRKASPTILHFCTQFSSVNARSRYGIYAVCLYTKRPHLQLIQLKKTFKCQSVLEFLVNNTLYVTLDFEDRTVLNFQNFHYLSVPIFPKAVAQRCSWKFRKIHRKTLLPQPATLL